MQHLVGAASRKELCDLCRSWIPRDRHLKMLSCQDHDDDESISQVDEETQKKALQTCLCLCQRVRQKKVWCRRKDLLWRKSALFVPSAKPAFTVPATRLRPARYLPRTTSVCTLNRYRSLSLSRFPFLISLALGPITRLCWRSEKRVESSEGDRWGVRLLLAGRWEGEANGEMVRGIVWEDRGTDGGVLLEGMDSVR
jgi:hypothetical protein